MYIICKKKSIFLLDFVWRFLYDVGKVLYKYCTSTFPISTLTIMFMYIMWWYIYEYHSCNCFVEINSIQFNSIIHCLLPLINPCWHGPPLFSTICHVPFPAQYYKMLFWFKSIHSIMSLSKQQVTHLILQRGMLLHTKQPNISFSICTVFFLIVRKRNIYSRLFVKFEMSYNVRATKPNHAEST